MVNPASLGPGGIALEALAHTEASWAGPTHPGPPSHLKIRVGAELLVLAQVALLVPDLIFDDREGSLAQGLGTYICLRPLVFESWLCYAFEQVTQPLCTSFSLSIKWG